MSVNMLKTPAEQAFASAFEAKRSNLPGNAAVQALRQNAFSAIAAEGLPHRRVETWKYTDLRASLRDLPPPAEKPKTLPAQPAPLAGVESIDLVLVDGYFVPELSQIARLPAGVTVVSMAQALAEGRADVVAALGALPQAKGDAAMGLNAAFMSDGVVIDVASGVRVAVPLRLVSLRSSGAATASAARSLLRLGDDAALFLIEEQHGGEAGHFTNDVLEISLGARAALEHVLIQQVGASQTHLSTLTAELSDETVFNSFALTTGAGLSRRQVYARFAGEHAELGVRGVQLLRGKQHADATLNVIHAAPHGTSRELFKTVVDGEASGVFQGKIVVEPHAQKTDGRMHSAALLLGEEASMNNKPELEIFADDVQCAHGATVGALDADLLFYAMARGIARPEAEALLLQAFIGEAVEFVSHDALRAVLMSQVEGWLATREAT